MCRLDESVPRMTAAPASVLREEVKMKEEKTGDEETPVTTLADETAENFRGLRQKQTGES